MKNVLKSYLSCAMCLVLLGGSLPKVNAAEVVKLQANGEEGAPNKFNLAIQMIYSCKPLRNKIIEVGNNFKVIEREADQGQKLFINLSKLFTFMNEAKERSDVILPEECMRELSAYNLYPEAKVIIGDILQNLKKVTGDLNSKIDEIEMGQASQLKNGDVCGLIGEEKEYFFVYNSSDGQINISESYEVGNKIFDLKSVDLLLADGQREVIYLKSDNKWICVDGDHFIEELNFTQLSAEGTIKNAVYCRKGEFAGLSNVGNSCYYNAAIQQLYNCEEFRNEILGLGKVIEDQHEEESIPEDLVMIYRLSNVFKFIDEARVKGSSVNKEIMENVIGNLVDKKQGDSVDVSLGNLLDEANVQSKLSADCLDFFSLDRMLCILNPDDEMTFATDILEKISKCCPNENTFSIPNFFSLIYSLNGNSLKSNILLSLDGFSKQDVIFNEVEIIENKCCTLKSIVVNTGHHFIIWVLNEKNRWDCISDSNLMEKNYDFEQMIKEIKGGKHIITSIMCSAQ